jgi:hypothetical protein
LERPRWSLRLTRSAGEAQATAFARKLKLGIGPPLTFDENEPQLTALELLLAALGADLLNGFEKLARERRVEIDHLEAVVLAELEDPLAHLGVVGATGTPRLTWASVKVYVSSLADEPVLRVIWADAVWRSPLVSTLSRSAWLELEMKAA